jgi:hypothetical protein
MGNLKVLKHTVYLYSKHRDSKLIDELNNYHEEITPVYHRDGEYLLGDKCWFEVRGRAFTKRKEDFLFELEQLSLDDIDLKVIEHLKSIARINSNILTPKQNKLIYSYNHFLNARKNKRLSRKRIKEMILRVKSIKNKNSPTK